MRHNRLSYIVTALVYAGLAYSAPLSPSPLAMELDWDAMGPEMQAETKRVEGEWKERKEWKGYLCNGYYEYTTRVRGDVTKVEFELNEKGTVDVHGEMLNIHAGADGTYKSDTTLCIPLSGWTGIGLDSAQLEAVATFKGEGTSLKDMDLRITKTALGTIHIGKAVPAWFERFLTRQVNRTLAYVWRTKLGDWLSTKITEFIKKKIPENRRP